MFFAGNQRLQMKSFPFFQCWNRCHATYSHLSVSYSLYVVWLWRREYWCNPICVRDLYSRIHRQPRHLVPILKHWFIPLKCTNTYGKLKIIIICTDESKWNYNTCNRKYLFFPVFFVSALVIASAANIVVITNYTDISPAKYGTFTDFYVTLN